MADDVQITGVTTISTIATDEVGGRHYQFVKLADGTTDSNTVVAVGNGLAANALRVTIASDTTGDLMVAGDIADDSPDSGNPVKIGARAETSLASITIVTSADRVNRIADGDGLGLVKPYCPYGDILVERLADGTGNATACTVFGATAGARNYLTSIAIYNDSVTNAFVDFRDGPTGTIMLTLPCPAKGGAVTNFPLPLRQTTVGTSIVYDASTALSTLYISLIGFKSRL